MYALFLTIEPECVVSVYIEVIFRLYVAMIETVSERNHSRPGQPLNSIQRYLHIEHTVHINIILFFTVFRKLGLAQNSNKI